MSAGEVVSQHSWLAGPGASITISAGACVFNQTAFYSSNGDFEIDCVGPSVVIAKTPATFESESKTPESFTSSVSLHTVHLLSMHCNHSV